MKYSISLFATILIMNACTMPTKEITSNQKREDFFAEKNGCFLLYNMKTHVFEQVIGEQRCKERFTPYSSFKIPLAVMAFDSNVLKDEKQVLKWDGVKDSRQVVNQDHDARTWMRDSVVWFSQRVTTKMGKNMFQKYVNNFDYGNRDLSAGITKAWLVRPNEAAPALKISGYEQVEFMKKLWTGKLPASKKSIQRTQEITYLETSPKGYKLSGKTGSNYYANDRKVHFGWFISHLQNGESEYITVTNFTDLKPNEGGYGGVRAKEITKRLLAEKGLW